MEMDGRLYVLAEKGIHYEKMAAVSSSEWMDHLLLVYVVVSCDLFFRWNQRQIN